MEDVDIVAARPDPVQAAPAATTEPRTSRPRAAARPRGTPPPNQHPTPVALVDGATAETSDMAAAPKAPEVVPADGGAAPFRRRRAQRDHQCLRRSPATPEHSRP